MWRSGTSRSLRPGTTLTQCDGGGLSSNPPHGAYTRAARSRYVAFDILYVKEAGKEATSTIHLALGERKEILRQAVASLPEGRSSIPFGPAEVMRGRIMPLWPGMGYGGKFCELVTQGGSDAVAKVRTPTQSYMRGYA
jgi:hypothetical protein